MKYKAGDKVKIKSRKEIENLIEITDSMLEKCGTVMTIKSCLLSCNSYLLSEDHPQNFLWSDEMIEGLAEEEMPLDKAGQITDFEYEGLAYSLPEGYIFKDENGNVINARKIVLEKKKIVNLTQEQINTMVHERCVLFCKHCGCGIPRETCTSLGTCKEHDEYRAAIRTHLMEKKKTKTDGLDSKR